MTPLVIIKAIIAPSAAFAASYASLSYSNPLDLRNPDITPNVIGSPVKLENLNISVGVIKIVSRSSP